jgi:DNA repair protein RecN (Recombination protein N)
VLTRLSIRDVVLIAALDLDFEAGLGVLTGETGAGKSILLDALGLALGDRARVGLVRHGAVEARVSASFDPPGAALALLSQAEISIEPGEPLIIRRVVKADGGSRALVNDQPVSAALLRDLGGLLVEIHGQHDDRGLINPRGHRDLLDAFAKTDGHADAGAVKAAHEAWQGAVSALASAHETLDHAARDHDYLTHAVAELRALAPEAGEEETLATRRAQMQRGAKIADDLATIRALIEDADGGLAKLRLAARALDRIAEDHPLLAAALVAIDAAIIEGSMAEDKLRAAGEALAFNPAQLDEDEARLFELRAVARKHRVQPDELAAFTETLAAKLDAIEMGASGLAALEASVLAAQAHYVAQATRLSKTRAAAAARLDAAVAGELAPLKLDAARFRTVLTPLPESQWGAGGMDKAEFEISTNPGAPFAPLIKIASGGELSRFILALKVALAAQGSAATMVFDEIDRGVGGAVASAIGERLARLSDGAQVLVVTHSPQVAARGQVHYLIAKASEGPEGNILTRTSVRALSADERREEIARMLSGAEVTDEARAQAGRLLV